MKISDFLIRFTALTLLCSSLSLFAQTDQVYSQMEETKDKIDSANMVIFGILDEYPDANYRLIYAGEDSTNVTSVMVDNVDDMRDEQLLKDMFMMVNELENTIMNRSNRMGVYYVTERDPEPKMGYSDFYDELYEEITYPELAKDIGLEGSIYVHFLVNEEGNIHFAQTAHNITGYQDDVIDKLEKEAVSGIMETSGKWKPARVGGFPVSRWMMIPVEFKLKNPYVLFPGF